MMTRKPLILVNDDGWLDSSLQKEEILKHELTLKQSK
jgi:hypothetical protein